MYLLIEWYSQADISPSVPAGTQYSENIRWVFPRSCNVPGIQGTFREYVKVKYIFLKILQGNVVFVLKVYEMLIFWQIPVIAKQWFQNIWGTFHEFLFQKYSKDIPRILQCYENVFMKSKSFAGYPVKFLILKVSSIKMFLWTLLKPFFIESKELRVKVCINA